MNLAYLLTSLTIFTFLPTNIAERLKPGDPYLLVALAVIGKAFFDNRSHFLEALKKLKNPVLLVIVSYLVSSLISLYLSDSLKFTFRFVILMLFGAATASLIRSQKDVQVLMVLLFVLGFATGLHALYQIFNPPPVIQGLSAVEGLSNVRVFATFFNANIYAEFLLVSITAGLGLFFFFSSRTAKFLILVAELFLAFILFYTYSRGSFLGLICAIFVFFLLTYPRLLLPASGLFLLLTAIIPGFLQRIVETITFRDSSQFLRLRIWNTVFSTLDSARKIVIGSGPYSFKYEMMDFVRKSPERFFGYFSFQPHNIYLLWLVEGGIIMVLAWLFYFSYHIWAGIESYLNATRKSRRKDSFLIASLTAASCGLLINGFTETIFYHNQVLPFWFFINGVLLWSYLNLKQENQKTTLSNP